MRAREGWRRLGNCGEGHGGVEGPGKGDEAHGRLGRAMERVVRSREGWNEPRMGGEGHGGLERPGRVEESQGVL